MSLHGSRVLTDQIISVLQAASLTVGDATVPDTIPAEDGYVIVYPLTGGTMDGTLENLYEDAVVPYQLSAHGTSREQCEWVSDRVLATVLAASWTLTGRKVIRVAPAFRGGTLRDDDVQPPIYYAPDRYDFRTVPT